MEKEKPEWIWIREAPRYLRENYGITLSESLLRHWRFQRKYPIFSSLGRKIFVDIQGLLRILEENRDKEQRRREQAFQYCRRL